MPSPFYGEEMSAIQIKVKKDNYTDAVAITPSDSADLTDSVSALYIGGSGTGALRVDTLSGTTVNFAGLTAGTVLELAVKKVHSTGTGVTAIIGLK